MQSTTLWMVKAMMLTARYLVELVVGCTDWVSFQLVIIMMNLPDDFEFLLDINEWKRGVVVVFVDIILLITMSFMSFLMPVVVNGSFQIYKPPQFLIDLSID